MGTNYRQTCMVGVRFERSGRVDLLQGSISLLEICEKAKIVSEKLNVPIEDIGVHFITYVG